MQAAAGIATNNSLGVAQATTSVNGAPQQLKEFESYFNTFI
jgi:hypothetical protein